MDAADSGFQRRACLVSSPRLTTAAAAGLPRRIQVGSVWFGLLPRYMHVPPVAAWRLFDITTSSSAAQGPRAKVGGRDALSSLDESRGGNVANLISTSHLHLDIYTTGTSAADTGLII